MSARIRAACCAALLAAAARLFAAEPALVTVRFQGEVRTDWELAPRASSVSVARGEVFETQVQLRNRSAREVVAMVMKRSA